MQTAKDYAKRITKTQTKPILAPKSKRNNIKRTPKLSIIQGEAILLITTLINF